MPVLSVLLQIKMPVFSSLLWIKVASFSLLKIKNASFICFVADKKNVSFIFIVADQSCQFYFHCLRSKLPVLSLFLRIKTASFNLKCQRPKLPALSILSQIKIDQNCQLFIVEDKKCQYYLIVPDKKCQFSL